MWLRGGHSREACAASIRVSSSQADGRVGLPAASMRLVHHGRVLNNLDAQLKKACTAVNDVVHVYADKYPIYGLWTTPGACGVVGFVGEHVRVLVGGAQECI
jgi:hypothetical protein